MPSFEDFYIAEKMKKRERARARPHVFLEDEAGQEIDFVEEHQSGEEYLAYECRVVGKTDKLPALFVESCHPTRLTIISKTNIIADLA